MRTKPPSTPDTAPSSPQPTEENEADVHEPALPEDDSTQDADSDSSETNSSDEFDWDEELSVIEDMHEKTKARRGRALWLAFMKLARPVRTLLVGIIGTAFFITPLLVVDIRFHSNSTVRPQVRSWSLWLSITWAAACVTHLVVDAIPKAVVTVILFLGGHVERLKTQVEARLRVRVMVQVAYPTLHFVVNASSLRVVETIARCFMGLDSFVGH